MNDETRTPEEEQESADFEQAMAEILSYMLDASGLKFKPGAGTSLRPIGDGSTFEVLIGAKAGEEGTVIGTFDRDAVLEKIADIRRARQKLN